MEKNWVRQRSLFEIFSLCIDNIDGERIIGVRKGLVVEFLAILFLLKMLTAAIS
jgi:hypothetical protein